MIRLKDVTVRLDGRPVLNQVSVAVSPGQWLAVLGPNGAGKTTLLRAILGAVPHDGQLSAATQIAYVPQRPELPAGMTVAEYVALGRAPRDGWGVESPAGRTVRDRILASLNLQHLATRHLQQLSGGEAQRAVLARALVQEPQILLLDEPTSALDPHHRVQILNQIDLLRKETGLTVISAMHDIGLSALYADCGVVLSQGRVVLDGPIEQILLDPGFAAIFENRIRIAHLDDGALVAIPVRA